MKPSQNKKVILAALAISFLWAFGPCFAQDEGPFDESEPPFAPSIRRPGYGRPDIAPGSEVDRQPRVEKQDRKSKNIKSDDATNASSIEREHTTEKQLFELVNADRAKLNRGPLKLSPRLSAMAKAHAQDMMKKNFFSHVNKEGLDAQARAAKMNIGIGVYENIAYQQGDIEDSQKVINLENDFMSEPDGPKNHRYNILHPNHTSVGVGVAIKGDKLILVEEFTDAPPTGE
ncbi:CAP domain-containing protein [bacterium]|nr:CAP domain-containing protein [bacterium]QQR59869.1 MAG: CAP domain-containing protein [Candidatus Melainabacteria bacterium]